MDFGDIVLIEAGQRNERLIIARMDSTGEAVKPAALAA